MSEVVVSIKAEVDTSEIEAAMVRYDLVNRTDVLRMIAEAIKDSEARLPTTLRQARIDGRINAYI